MRSFDQMVRDMGRNILGPLANVTVTYRKAGDEQGLADRTISAHCRYRNEEPKDGKTRARYPTVQLSVVNEAGEGIASSELDTGGDVVLVPPRLGLTPRWMRIVRILTENSGWLTLELQ